MLKQEVIKQAIDAISLEDPEIGYSLRELFESGRIGLADMDEPPDHGGRYHYLFDNRPVPIKKINYFMEGAASIEQSLLIQYGEMEQKQILSSSREMVDFARVEHSIRIAGLMRLVRYEVNRIEKGHFPVEPRHTGNDDSVIDHRIKLADLRREMENPQWQADKPRALFTGAVGANTPAIFVSFPYTLKSLMQVADLELTFFSVRFVLKCLMNGTARQLFACLVDDAIAGLVYLRHKSKLLYKGLEIKYIATARDARAHRAWKDVVHRGAGTFLVAGAWLLWKNMFPDVQEIILDTERQALSFYQEIGFKRRRPYVYALTRPAGYLLNALAVMIDRSPDIRAPVIDEFLEDIHTQARYLARKDLEAPGRDTALSFIKLCLLARSRPQLAHKAAVCMIKYEARIPEADGLLHLAACYGRIQVVHTPAALEQPLLVFRHADLELHLQGVFHLENANRIKAIDTILADPALFGKWIDVKPRRATTEELAWVHTTGHIARIAATQGKGLHLFDLDTQTNENSYAAACLAVGGIFSLLDHLYASSLQRGFAAVRPPGHHAEPDRAMGFCLFNNIALGACYLKHIMGLKRIMIVDIDAHHGNGTQAAFYDSSEILYLSMHQFPLYPGSGNFNEIGCGRGEGHTVNVPLDRGMGDRELIHVINQLADPLAQAFEPEIIMVSCGFDLYQHDRLANLNGTPGGYAMLTRRLCRIADMVCGGRIVFIMEGGYSVQGIRDCGRQVLQEMCNMPALISPPGGIRNGTAEKPFPALLKTIDIHKKYWPILDRP